MIGGPSTFPSATGQFAIVTNGHRVGGRCVFLVMREPLRWWGVGDVGLGCCCFMLLSFTLALITYSSSPILLGSPISTLDGSYVGHDLPITPGVMNGRVRFTCTVTVPGRLKGLSSTRIIDDVTNTANACFSPGSCCAGSSNRSVPMGIYSSSRAGKAAAIVSFAISAYTTALHCCCVVPRRTHNGSMRFSFSIGTDGNRITRCGLNPCGVSGVSVTGGLSIAGSGYCLSFLGRKRTIRVCSGTSLRTGPSLTTGVSVVCTCDRGSSLSRTFCASSSPGRCVNKARLPSNFIGGAGVVGICNLRSQRLSSLRCDGFVSSLSFRAVSVSGYAGCVLKLGRRTNT